MITPHLNPLPFTKGRGGFIRVGDGALVRCCSRAVNHAAWAQTKRHFFFAENRSGKFNSKHCADCDRQKFFFRQEPTHHGGLTTCSSSRTFRHHVDRSAGLLLRWPKFAPLIFSRSRSICPS